MSKDFVDLEKEKQEIVKRYRQLLRGSKWSREQGDVREIRKAFEMAQSAHQDMRRKSGEPYIYHPIAVARIAAEEIGLGTTSIVAALLHDVVEDTDLEYEDIKREFGAKVANIVEGLTKISGVFNPEDDTSPQVENYRKMLLTLSDDVRVILIKLCDRLHNMRTLQHMSRKGQLKIASETLFIYAPLAHRLGLYAIKTELEDLSLKYTQPDRYQQIKQKLSATKEQRTRFIRSFIKPVKMELEQLKVDVEIKGRSKSIYSIHKKMEAQGIPFEQVYDLFAIRIIMDSKATNEKKDCWNAYSIVTSIFRPNPDRLRDWISIPKSNGYESLHTTVMGPRGKWVEVQIRSRRMDEIAERGYAAHWKYKESKSSSSALDNWLVRVREILEEQQEDSFEFLDEFKSNLFAEEVFVFTPKGQLRKLPNHSTTLDFAFDIHTEVGAKCIGAKVNNKLVPLSSTLNNGDQVEILTSKKQKPNADWLKYVVTGKAKNKIKQLLKEERRALAKDGREILERKFRNASEQFSAQNLRHLCKYFGVVSEADLYEMIAREEISKEQLKVGAILKKLKEKKVKHKRGVKGKSTTQEKKDDLLIIGENEVQLDYAFAKCCNPIPGDEVIGFITIGEGIKIHRTSCKNALRLMSQYGYRVIKARWAGEMRKEEIPFTADLTIKGIDSMGLVSKITNVISKDLKVNMKAISFEAIDGTFVGKLTAQVKNTEELKGLIDALRKIDSYVYVERTGIEENDIKEVYRNI